jgi:hypothetical protein
MSPVHKYIHDEQRVVELRHAPLDELVHCRLDEAGVVGGLDQIVG